MIVAARQALGLTVSEAETGVIRLLTRAGGPVPFTAKAAGQGYKVEFVYLAGTISADWDLRSVEVHNASTSEGMDVLWAV